MTQSTIKLSKALKALRSDHRNNSLMLTIARTNNEKMLYRHLETVNESIRQAIESLSRKYQISLRFEN